MQLTGFKINISYFEHLIEIAWMILKAKKRN